MKIARNLSELLNGRVKLATANNEIVMRFGGKGNEQFQLSSIDGKGEKWSVDKGPAISIIDLDYKLKFKEALKELANKIIEFGKNKTIRFNLLVMPLSSVEVCRTEICENIIVRYIEAYIPATDNIGFRYDILVSEEK